MRKTQVNRSRTKLFYFASLQESKNKIFDTEDMYDYETLIFIFLATFYINVYETLIFLKLSSGSVNKQLTNKIKFQKFEETYNIQRCYLYRTAQE